MRPLFIRADASASIGTGHVMRCISLAQAWQDAGDKGEHQAWFICAQLPEPLKVRLSDNGFHVVTMDVEPGSGNDIRTVIETISGVLQNNTIQTPAWVVTDGYTFGLEYQRALRGMNRSLLIIDDYNHLDAYECDLLLNQNAGAEKFEYSINDDAVKLLGPSFALLRREFVQAKVPVRDVGKRRSNLLITMGGADPDNVTGRIVEMVSGAEGLDLNIRMIVGGSNKHIPELQQLASSLDTDGLEVLVDVADMVEQMQWADMVLTAGGSTCWELCRMGVPMAIVVLAENQKYLADYLEKAGIAINLREGQDLKKESVLAALEMFVEDDERYGVMSVKGRELVDGMGGQKVVADMLGINEAVSKYS